MNVCDQHDDITAGCHELRQFDGWDKVWASLGAKMASGLLD